MYADANGDGQKGPGEFGLSGVTVYLDTDRDGTWDANESVAFTGDTGEYNFENLAAGEYLVRQVGPVGYKSTGPQGPTKFFYGIDYGNDSLVRIDAKTGSITQIGAYGGTNVTALVGGALDGDFVRCTDPLDRLVRQGVAARLARRFRR